MKISAMLAPIGLLCVPMLNVDPAHAAGASRTWVSGAGSDMNPCSRTAPCSTLAAAYSNTAPGGEINCVDPGGVGTLTITMSITIDCRETFAGILAAGTHGIVVNAGVGDIVTLKGLNIQGAGTGLNGIKFLSGHSLYVTDVTIQDFTQWGIDFEPSGSSQLFVGDAFISNNGSVASSGGILVQPSGTGSADVTLDKVRVVDNVVGILAKGSTSSGAGVRVDVNASVVANNFSNGVWGLRGAGAQTLVLVDGSRIVNNTGTGVLADTSAAVLISSSTIVRNGVGANVSGGTLYTYGNNVIDNNAGIDLSPSAIVRTTK
jgi:hypothetical protein